MTNVPLYSLVLIPFAGSIIALSLPANARNAESTLAGFVALVCLVPAALMFPEVIGGGVIREEIAWIPSLGLNLVFRMDGFAWLFCMLVLGIGALVVLYARYYMSAADPVPRFFAFLLAFMGAMMGVVLSGNVIQLVLFWELTSLFSFLLIGYWHHRLDARRGARMALLITGTGGLCLLAGVLVLGHVAQSYELDIILAQGDAIRSHPFYPLILGLILIGAFTKSAQFPFHFWLPNAMAAPTPVSAYLHSATMVKAGVFLLARLWPVLAGTDLWFWCVTGTGAITLLLGGYFAMFHRDLKGLLAYSTISHLGLITLLLGLNSSMATVAAVFHIINHATFKASLFMAAGIIDHETGTRDICRLSGLFKLMPSTSVLAIVSSAAMAGVPMLNGFLSKEMFFSETVFMEHTTWLSYALPTIATVAGSFSVVYALRFTVDVFFGPPPTALPNSEPHDPPFWMRAPVAFLAAMCLAVGIAPQFMVGNILAAAATPVVGGHLPQYSLAIWHGFNLPLIMSIVAMAAGVGLFIFLRKMIRQQCAIEAPILGSIEGKDLFRWTLVMCQKGAHRLFRIFSTDRLQLQLLALVTMTLFAAAMSMWSPYGGLNIEYGPRTDLPLSPVFVLLWGVGMAAAVGTAWHAKFHRLQAFLLMSVAGLITCLTFVWFSAPDLALTQLSVEVVTAILILLGLRWLPKRFQFNNPVNIRARVRRVRDFAIAGISGFGMAALAYAVMTRDFPQSISNYFLQYAEPEGGGTNVVNVMLVDFRSFDTLGEITVLAAAALTVYALLRRFRPAAESMELPPQQRAVPPDLETDLVNARFAKDTAVGYLTVPAVLARLLLPIAILISAYLFLRGHNEPGGGFIAGLIFTIAIILQYMIAGTQWVEERLRHAPQHWIALGLLAAAGTGLGALALGYPFLTTHTAHLDLPIIGEIHLPSALFFDIGVFAVVVGATLLILTALAHQSVRSHRLPSRRKSEESDTVIAKGANI